MTAIVRPATVDDVPQLMELWRREVASGRTDIVPDEPRFRRLLARFDWEGRSRVVEEGGCLLGSVLVTSRPSPEGVLAIVYPAGEGAAYGDMADWAVRLAQAAGASIVQVFAGKGCAGAELERAGLRKARAWWRMDRRLAADLPRPVRVPGYDIADGGTSTATDWAGLFNGTFADHWRFAPRVEHEIVGDKRPELCLLAVTAHGREPVALALADLETYSADPRPQPVALISSVGTLPGHRRRGLAGMLVAELLARGCKAGALVASLYVDGDSPMHAERLYRNLGFEVAYEAEVWEATKP